jgi:hypothetical protein
MFYEDMFSYPVYMTDNESRSIMKGRMSTSPKVSTVASTTSEYIRYFLHMPFRRILFQRPILNTTQLFQHLIPT